MTEFSGESHQTQLPITNPRQNWDVILGIGVVCIIIVLVGINIWAYFNSVDDTEPNLLRSLPLWLQISGVIGVVGVLGGGCWFLWCWTWRKQATLPSYEVHLQKALHYTQNVERLLKMGANPHEAQLLDQIYAWRTIIETIAQALTDLADHDNLIAFDLRQMPNLIIKLEQQVAQEADPIVKNDLAQMLIQRQNQQQALQQLQNIRRRAEIQIERTIAVLGTIYSQLLTYRSSTHVIDYQRLADNVASEVRHLEDYLAALQEVKGTRP